MPFEKPPVYENYMRLREVELKLDRNFEVVQPHPTKHSVFVKHRIFDRQSLKGSLKQKTRPTCFGGKHNSIGPSNGLFSGVTSRDLLLIFFACGGEPTWCGPSSECCFRCVLRVLVSLDSSLLTGQVRPNHSSWHTCAVEPFII